MLAAVCHGKKDLRIEQIEDRPLGAGEVRMGVAFGGICGSDMHYYHRGAVGDFAVREPMTLGHEVSGVVIEVGDGVNDLTPGMKAAIDPSRPCLTCRLLPFGPQQFVRQHVLSGERGPFPARSGRIRAAHRTASGPGRPCAHSAPTY